MSDIASCIRNRVILSITILSIIIYVLIIMILIISKTCTSKSLVNHLEIVKYTVVNERI
jgi:hypothetical protein